MSDDDTFDPVLVLSRLLRKHAFNLYAPHACLLLINPGQANLTIEYGMGIMEPYVGRIIQNSDGVAGHVLSTNQPHFIPDYLQWAKRYNRLIPDTQTRFNAVAGTPVYRNGELWAILSFIWEDGSALQPEAMLAALTEIGNAATNLIARLADIPNNDLAPLPMPKPLASAL